jgi:hypothetical protein
LKDTESEVRFAFSLYDTDGSGSLEEHEAVAVLRSALMSDVSHYGHRSLHEHEQDPQSRCPVRGLVEDVLVHSGQSCMSLREFELLVARVPRVFLPAQWIYQHLHKFSAAPKRLIASLSDDKLRELINRLGHPMPPDDNLRDSGFSHYYSHTDSTMLAAAEVASGRTRRIRSSADSASNSRRFAG